MVRLPRDFSFWALACSAFVTGCFFCCYSLLRQLAVDEYLTPQWYSTVLMGLASFAVAALTLDSRQQGPRSSTGLEKPLALFWLAVVFLLLAFRSRPFGLWAFPDGLAFEENREAYFSRGILLNSSGSANSLIVTDSLLASFFSLFGISEATLRLFGATFGALSLLVSAMLFAKLFPLMLALVGVSFVASEFSLLVGSQISQDACCVALFLVPATLYFLFEYLDRKTFLNVLLLTIFSTVCGMDYVAVKPLAVIGLAPIFYCELRELLSGRANRFDAFLRLLMCIAVSLLLVVLVATPQIVDWIRGGSGLLDGRRDLWVGDKAGAEFELRIPAFAESLKEHLRMLASFNSDGGPWLFRDPLMSPVLAWTSCLGALVGVAFIFCGSLIRRRFDRNFKRFILWLGWFLVALGFCAFWNYVNIQAYRLLTCVFLAVLVLLEGLNVIWKWSPRAGNAIALLLIIGILGWNFRELRSFQNDPVFTSQFRSKTSGICQYLERQPEQTGYLFYADWTDSNYFGDESPEAWSKATAGNGYDSWSCAQNYKLKFYSTRPELQHAFAETSNLRNKQRLLIAVRYTNDDDYRENFDTQALPQRAEAVLKEIGADRSVLRCSEVTSGQWHLYYICEKDV